MPEFDYNAPLAGPAINPYVCPVCGSKLAVVHRISYERAAYVSPEGVVLADTLANLDQEFDPARVTCWEDDSHELALSEEQVVGLLEAFFDL